MSKLTYQGQPIVKIQKSKKLPFELRAQNSRAAHRVRSRISLFAVPVLGFAVVCAHAQTQKPITQTAPSTDAPSEASNNVPGPSAKRSTPPVGADNAKEPTLLDTVVITANRRREPQKEIPMQVTALSTKQLDQDGDASMRDYLSKQPGVSLNGGGGIGGGAGATSISMRGITTGSDIGPTVGVYIDDVPLGSSTAWGYGAQLSVDMALLDLDHVEILKGPQGTLYGAGSMGGLLKYVTNQPDSDTFSGKVSTGVSGTEHGGLNTVQSASVNIPLKQDVAALRIAAFNETDAGYVNRIGRDPEKGVDGATTNGGRASLLLTPMAALSLQFTALAQHIKRDGTNFVDYNATSRNPIYGDLTQSRAVNEPFDQNIEVYSASADYDLGWARFDSITAYQKMRTNETQDYSSVYVPLFAGAFDGVGLDTHVQTKKFTQEFRLTSPSNRKLEWLAGLFYTHEASHLDEGLFGTSATGAVTEGLLIAGVPTTYQEMAAYGDVTYHFTTRLSGTAGLRVAHNKQVFDQNLAGVIEPSSNEPGNSSDTSKTYLFALNYLLNKDSSVYARVASGYNPGGAQVSYSDATTGSQTPRTFQPDSLRSYEVGYKASLFDKRAAVTVALFDIEWNDIQLHDTVNGLGYIANGGKARSQGAEAFASTKPWKQWAFTVGATYTNAKLTQDVPGLGAYSGDALPNTPKWAMTARADYSFNIARYAAYVGASENYTGARSSGFNLSATEPNIRLPGYLTTDLRAGVDFQHASVAFFVHNLFNRRGWTGSYTTLYSEGGPLQISLIQPLTVGLNVTVPF